MEVVSLQSLRSPPPAAGGRLPLGELLISKGVITREQLEQALSEKDEHPNRRLGEILTAHGWASGRAIAEVLAEQNGLEYVELGQVEPEESAATLLPEHLARRYEALPIRFVDDDTVLVVVADPSHVLNRDNLRLALGLHIKLAVADVSDVKAMIDRVWRQQIDVESDTGIQPFEEDEELVDIGDAAATNAPAIKLVNSILSRAIEDGASDLHFEPQARHMTVRARIDGVSRTIATIPKAVQAPLTSRLKVMGELDIAERRVPQDGRVSIRFQGIPTDMRIAVLPTTYGEQVVLRIFQHRAGGALGLADLGMRPDAAAAFERAIRQPYGAVITCGPTGSGKTTTLYAALDLLNEEERVLMTVEDPVEYQIAGVNQVEVNTKSGLTFARGLRTILRSDPDVLLVGEVRDEETANIAIQAAMTGHLVLSTLHSQDAASSVARLRNMGVDASLIATCINSIVAQRLARRLCSECREPYTPGEHERAELQLHAGAQALYRPAGCSRCSDTGYRGRVALYEILTVEGHIRRLIEEGASTEAIREAAVVAGMTTLRQDGLRLVLEGITSLEEVCRVTGDFL
jgi:type IV pilus assembly protein PilB